MHSIKSTFSHSLDHGKFWHLRFYFHIVDSGRYLLNVLSYIEHNFRKMDLLEKYGQSPFVYFDHAAIEKLLA